MDLIHDDVRYVFQELIESEATSVIGAGPYERSEGRVTERRAIVFVCGLNLLAPVRPWRAGRRRISLRAAGTVITLCGAWFVIGAPTWPVLNDVPGYFVAADPLRKLANQVGYALGPGLLMADYGAFAVGWAARHNQALGSSMRQATEARGAEPAVGDSYQTVA